MKHLLSYRLVSAYANKVLDTHVICGPKTNSSSKWCNKMASVYGEYRNFSSFVNDVIEQYTESGCYKNISRPCFEINGHWNPFNNRCLHCDIPYNVIGRMETFEEDVRYIILKNKLENLFPLKETIRHLKKSTLKK